MARLQPNHTLRQLVVDGGYTHEGLAESVNDATERLTGRRGSASARVVRRWLSGEVAWPRAHSRRALEEVFGWPAEKLGFRAPSRGHSMPGVTVGAPDPPQEPPVHRRQFVLGLTGSLLPLPALPMAGRLGVADVERVRAAATKLHQLDDQYGGGTLADIAAQYIEYVEQAARRCTYGDRVQTGLYRALGEVATTAGWLNFDAGRQRTARRWWDTALRYALLASDKQLQTRIWSSMSHQASELGHGGEAVMIARAALDATRGRRESRLSALLHTRVARGHSVQGDRGPCARSLLQAEQAHDRGPAMAPQRWLAFFNPGEISGAAALCHRDLRQYPAAVKAARRSLAVLQETSLQRNKLAAHVRLGRILAAAGELDEALAAGNNALAVLPGVRSPRIEDRLRQLGDDLLGRGPAGAAEFFDRYRGMTASCP
ncbi:tetratricopeptide repeat protein [Streptomyces johnsoniae]|uniref:Transcriptional regulator n=1 Tax=Streptomyces johnsoniae TaxID=3075532 RepID=A0ABU2S595_9ACTN|nr:hypothetical protein [Streptomyces sp. DSM 41886]MDT0444152.1 hypothetical protein [Streptomyces sp. DSM 41886]